jgi:hypothetical protein
MQYVCESPPYTWFRIETEAEAALEAQAMDHAVERYFHQAHEQAAKSYTPSPSLAVIEQNIGLRGHIQRAMPMFLTLRDGEGKALVTAMLPPKGQDLRILKPIIVGFGNSDPFAEYGEAIQKLADHFGLTLDRSCYPYRRK